MKNNKTWLIGIVAAAVLSLSGCGTEITSIKVPADMKNLTINKGDTQVVTLVNEYSEESVTEEEMAKALEKAGIKWNSSDNSIVKVENGTVKALKAGEADVTVTGKKEEINETFHVTVVVPLKDFTVPSEIVLIIGKEDSKEIGVVLEPADSTEKDKIEFTSSDDAIVTVDKSGKLTAVEYGEATVTVTFGEIVKEIAITIKVKATSIDIASGGWIYKGGAYTLNPGFAPYGAESEALTFSSSDSSVASVAEDGTVYGAGIGSAVIEINSESGLTSRYTMVVKAVPAYTPPKRGSSTGSGSTGGGSSTGGGGSSGGGSSSGGGTVAPPPIDTGWVSPGDGAWGGGGF
ncbi:MAG: Ig-like domain-containing protein [Oscillospiraceae bacterium]